ncbi:MAG: hypothetical protein HN952_02795 [Candidatus Cloacimonetes bacterium]|nr:hypothetical protein [Candidatus Cloacimonadota bacterium]MBT7470339.1 hypothetical protein [Candidatus Cloacimonadota bacterium]
MKKTMVMVGMIIILMTSLSAEISKNELNGGAKISLNKANEKIMTLPHLTHAFEIEDGSFMFGLETETFLDFDNEFESAFTIAFTPSIEFGFAENFAASIAFPLEFANNEFVKNVKTEVSFGTLEEDIEGISAWAAFENGFNVSAIYGQEIIENAEQELALNFDYAYLIENQNIMFKTSAIISKSFVDDAEIEPLFSLQIAKDLSHLIAINTTVELNLDFEIIANCEFLFYPIEKIEITTLFNYGAENYEIGINFNYLIFE